MQGENSTSADPAAVFGEILRGLRKGKLSQEKLALESGLDRTYISLLERGKRQPTLGTLLQIAGVLGVTASDLVAAVEERIKA